MGKSLAMFFLGVWFGIVFISVKWVEFMLNYEPIRKGVAEYLTDKINFVLYGNVR